MKKALREYDPEDRVDEMYHAVELGGEAGEALNEVKKLKREDLGIVGSRSSIEKLAAELADVLMSACHLANAYGIQLDAAVKAKFNVNQERFDLVTRL